MSRSENFDATRIHTTEQQLYGIRLQLVSDDPFKAILGNDWESARWFATKKERDQALSEIRKEHPYSRQGDAPRYLYEAIESTPPTPLFSPTS